jgi:hypothetical protein
MAFDKKDIIYCAMLAIFSFLLLAQLTSPFLSSYSSLAEAKLAGKQFDSSLLPAVIGTVFVVAIFVLLRLRFSQISSLVTTLLVLTATSFIQNFAAGSFSPLLTAALIGKFDLTFAPSFAKLTSDLLLLPFALLGTAFLVFRRKLAYVAIAAVAVVLTLVYPLIALPFLAALSAFAIDDFKAERRDDLVAGLLFSLFLTLFLLKGISAQTVAISLFVSVLVAAGLFITDARHKVCLILIISIVFLSIIGATTAIFVTQRLDTDAASALSQLTQLGGKITIASPYGESIVPAALYLSGKEVTVSESQDFLLSNTTAKPPFDYLMFDTIVLDSKNWTRGMFDTFAFSHFEKQNDTNYAVFGGSRGNYLLLFMDNNGRITSDKAFISDVGDISFYRLLELNATDPRYTRYLYPREKTSLNIFKLLFPEQFGSIGGIQISQQWISNSSRIAIYTIG